jgi:DNA-binding LacI/PurR family transcriptional regulator
MRYGLVPGSTFSVIGFDDTPVVRYMVPAMTTVRQPLAEIGSAMLVMFEALLANRIPPQPQQILRPQLIIRDSCAPLSPR